jgi:uncharacterized protein YjbJ (UPF0337 family)
MDRKHVKGAPDKLSGVVKDTAGKLMRDQKLQQEGKVDKAKGESHKQMRDLKESEKSGQFGDD